jgi:Protein of unknown function (DUF4031)
MIYVDEIKFYPNTNLKYKKWCHLWTDSDNIEELHLFAEKLGLKRDWFQNKKNIPHYDLVPTKRDLAIQFGAQQISIQQFFKENKK